MAMSFDAYINIMIGSLVVLIFTIVVEITEIKNNKPGRKRRKILAGLIVVIIIFGVVLSIFYYNSKQGNQETTFAALVTKGEFEYSNSHYINAAKYFYEANLVAYDSNSEVYSLQMQATCYYVYGLFSNDNKYLIKAMSIYRSIMENAQFANYESYKIAIIDLCNIYYFLGYDWTDGDWIFTVKYLEEEFNFEDENITPEESTIVISAGVSLCYYYRAVLFSSVDQIISGEEYRKKAIYYLTVTSELELKYNEYIGANAYDEPYYTLVYEMTSNIITSTFFDINEDTCAEDNLLILEEARVICRNALLSLNIESNNQWKLVLYIQLKRNIGKSYFFSAFWGNRESNMQQAYEELKFPFYWEDDIVTGELIKTASYSLLTGLCTDADVETILNTCESRLESLHTKTDVPQLINAHMDTLEICSHILRNYSCCQTDAYRLGHLSYIELNTLFFDLLDASAKDILETYRETFEN